MKPSIATMSFNVLIILITSLPADSAVLPNSAEVAGRTIPEWSAEWWKWVFSVPAGRNPLTDEDGRWATNNNAGPVFFLAGVIAISSTQTRSFEISEDQYVLMPLLNTWTDNVAVDPPFTLEQ